MIQFQILWTNILRIVHQTVQRITKEIFGVKGLRESELKEARECFLGKKTQEYDWIVINSFNDFVEITPGTFFIKLCKKNETVATSYMQTPLLYENSVHLTL